MYLYGKESTKPHSDSPSPSDCVNTVLTNVSCLRSDKYFGQRRK